MRTFAIANKERDLAQLVAHTSGGREVAGSSPVIPTCKSGKREYLLPLFLDYISIDFFRDNLMLRYFADSFLFHIFAKH